MRLSNIQKIIVTCILVMATNTDPSLAEKSSQIQKSSKSDSSVKPLLQLPDSDFLDSETLNALEEAKSASKNNPCDWSWLGPDPERVAALQECLKKYEYPRQIAKLRSRYAVDIQPITIAGVKTVIVTPKAGVPDKNRNRVLINLHGGGFILGDPHIESIPIASTGQIKVVGIDYRMGPTHKFPAANEDIIAVYTKLLEDYRPENIGIYGCSAGGILTAQSIAWFKKASLPLPGAINMSCAAAATLYLHGDSQYINAAMQGKEGKLDFSTSPEIIHYYGSANMGDRLISPGMYPEILKQFPPSLLIASTRDYQMSDVVYTHSRLVKLGVEAHLHIWEGLGHGFFYNAELPESRDVYNVIVKFFDRFLGTNHNT